MVSPGAFLASQHLIGWGEVGGPFIQYEKKLIFGTQFHPEMSLDGNSLIENFCSL